MPYDDRSLPRRENIGHFLQLLSNQISMKNCITRNMEISLGVFYIAILVGKCSVHTLDTDTLNM